MYAVSAPADPNAASPMLNGAELFTQGPPLPHAYGGFGIVPVGVTAAEAKGWFDTSFVSAVYAGGKLVWPAR